MCTRIKKRSHSTCEILLLFICIMPCDALSAFTHLFSLSGNKRQKNKRGRGTLREKGKHVAIRCSVFKWNCLYYWLWLDSLNILNGVTAHYLYITKFWTIQDVFNSTMTPYISKDQGNFNFSAHNHFKCHYFTFSDIILYYIYIIVV